MEHVNKNPAWKSISVLSQQAMNNSMKNIEEVVKLKQQQSIENPWIFHVQILNHSKISLIFSTDKMYSNRTKYNVLQSFYWIGFVCTWTYTMYTIPTHSTSYALFCLTYSWSLPSRLTWKCSDFPSQSWLTPGPSLPLPILPVFSSHPALSFSSLPLSWNRNKRETTHWMRDETR